MMQLGVIISLIFMILKLCGVIGWSWFLMTLPMFILLLIWLIMVILGIFFISKVESGFRV